MNAPDTCTCPEHGDWMAAAGVKRLVRQLDVALNGEAGASARPALIDVVAQVLKVVRERGAPLLAAATNPPAIGSSVVVGQPPSGGEMQAQAGLRAVLCGDAMAAMNAVAEGASCAHAWNELDAKAFRVPRTAPLSAPVGVELPPEAEPVGPVHMTGLAAQGDWAIPTKCGARIVDARMAYGWNECRKAMQKALAQQPAASTDMQYADTDALIAHLASLCDDGGQGGEWDVAQAAIAGIRAHLQPAAVECPHRTRCDCLAACKYGYAGDGALAAQPGGVTQPASGGVSNASLAQPQEPQR